MLNRLFSPGVNAGGASSRIRICGVSTSTRASASSAFARLRDYSPARQAACKYHPHATRQLRQLHDFQRLPDAFSEISRPSVTLARKVSASTTGLAAPLPRPGAARCDLAYLMATIKANLTFR